MSRFLLNIFRLEKKGKKNNYEIQLILNAVLSRSEFAPL